MGNSKENDNNGELLAIAKLLNVRCKKVLVKKFSEKLRKTVIGE